MRDRREEGESKGNGNDTLSRTLRFEISRERTLEMSLCRYFQKISSRSNSLVSRIRALKRVK